MDGSGGTETAIALSPGTAQPLLSKLQNAPPPDENYLAFNSKNR